MKFRSVAEIFSYIETNKEIPKELESVLNSQTARTFAVKVYPK
jgi:hypothetical protein